MVKPSYLAAFLLLTLLSTNHVLAAACPVSSSAETSGASNGDSCDVTDGTTGTVITLRFISGFDSATLIENDTAAPTATDSFFFNAYGLDAVQVPADIADAAATQSKASGNNGTTIGAQRKLAFIKAAEILASQIVSTEPVLIDADFTTLACSQGGATLGSASASSFVQNASAPAGALNSTWYPVGLYNSLDGADNYPSGGPLNANPNTVDNGGAINADSDIFARYNASTGITNCLDSSNGWYYGFDAPPSEVYMNAGGSYLTDGNGDPVQTTYIGFTTVLLHEMLHGMGFSSLTDSSGNELGSLNDIYATFLRDDANNRNWSDASESAANRAASAISSTGLLWTGTNVNTQAIGLLTAGFQDNDSSSSFTSGDRVQMYAPNPAETGSSISHFNTALSPNEIMEPQYTAGSLDIGLALYLLKDIGWTINDSSNTAPTITITGTPYSTNEDTVKVIDASSWDADVDGDTITFSVSSCPANITCAIDSDGQNLTLTPASNYNGATNSVEITVTDDGTGSLSASASFNLAVVAQNDAPQWSAISTQNVTIGGSTVDVDLSTYASDVEGDTLTYSQISCGTGLSCSLTGSTMTLGGVSNAGATVSVEVQADDSQGGQTNKTFSVNINAAGNTAPTITITGTPYSTNEDTVKVIDASSWGADGDGDTITFSVSSCPANITCAIDSDGQNLTLTPASNYNGATNSVEITVTDDGTGSLSASASFNLAVVAQNDTPSLTITGTPYSTNEDTAKVIDASSWDADVDGDTITFSVSSCPANITCAIDSDGQNLTLTPADNYNGAINSVEITVTDDGTGSLSASASFNLEVVAQNDAPQWSAISTQSVTIGGSTVDVDLSTYASDVEGDTLSYSQISCGTGLSCSLSGSTITLGGVSNAGATVNVEVQADDSNGGQTNKTFSVNINAASNTAPTITITGTPYSTNEDTVKVIDASSWDADVDGDTITFSVSSCPANITCAIDSDGQNLTLTPASNYNGATNSVEITVTDDGTGSLSASASFNLAVVAQNDAPTWATIPNQNLTVGDSATINLSSYATDADGDTLTYTGCEATSICSISSNTLTINTAAVASESITINANDGNGGSTNSASFSIAITAASPSTAAQINGTDLQDGDEFAIALETTSINITGGSGSYGYALEYQGVTANNLLTTTATGVDVAMPTSGAFAGTYTLQITDTSNSETIEITLVRPLRAVWSSEGLLNGDITQTLRIEGGAVGSEYELSDANSLLSFDQAGIAVSSVLATDDTDQFNVAEVTLQSATVTDIQAIDFSITTLNNNYPVLSETTFSIYPASNHTFTITDGSAAPLQNATLTLTSSALLTSLNLELTHQTNQQGIATIHLPTSATGFTLQAGLSNYASQSVSFDNSQLEHSITLLTMENSITLSGSISALGLQNFITNKPSVVVKLSDGSEIAVTVTVSTATQASFNQELDLNQLSLETLTVNQADSLGAEIDISNTTQNMQFNILLETNVVVVVSTPSETSVGSSGGSLGLFYLMMLGLFLRRPLLTKLQ